jgi:hypothetical protein
MKESSIKTKFILNEINDSNILIIMFLLWSTILL